MLRQLPPVSSPLSLSALLSGLRSSLSSAAAARATEVVESAVISLFAGRRLLLTDSGTSALALAIRYARRPLAPVAIPAFGCFDIATAVCASGLPFVCYDVDPATLSPDLASLQRAVAAGADRVVIAHLYGIPAALDAVKAAIAGNDVSLIDDAAQGVGASYRGRPLGAHGSLGVLSFGRGKGLTGGGGGALLAFDALGEGALDHAPDLPPRPTRAREVVALLAQWLLARPALYRIPSSLPGTGLGETHFQAPHEATAPSRFAVGVLSCSLRSVEEEAGSRARHATRLADSLRLAGYSPILAPPNSAGGFLRLPFIAPSADVAHLRSASARALGIMPSYPISLDELPGFAERRLEPTSDNPGARYLSGHLFTAPTHGFLNETDLRAIERFVVRSRPLSSSATNSLPSSHASRPV